MGYFKDVIKGLSWTVGLRAYTRILSLIRLIILARFFLNPYEFGLFGIVTLVLSLLEVLTETGINVFLIQEKNPISHYVNAAWIVSLGRGTLIGAILACMSGFISSFFHTTAAAPLLLLTAIIPFIKGFINPCEIIFQKELTFDKEFFFRSSILTIESIAIISFAFITHNAYSFIYGMIISAFFEVLLSFIFISPRPVLSFSLPDIKHIFHRGKWVTLYGVFQYFAENTDNIIVGKILGVSSLAVYENAYTISILPVSEIVDVANKVIFPVFVKIKEDSHRLLRAFIKSAGIITILSILCSCFITFFARQIVLYTFGDKWVSIVSILPLLALYGGLRAIIGFPSSLFLALQRQDLIARMIFIRFLALIITVIPLTLIYGIYGTVYAALISVILEFPASLLFTLHIFKNYAKSTR